MIRSLAILFSALAPFTFAFLAWATVYLDATIATILWGSWPILVVLFLARFDRATTRATPVQASVGERSRIRVSLLLLMLLGLVGLAFAVLSQSTPADATRYSQLTDSLSLAGIAIALGSAWLASLTAWHFRWANTLVGQLDRQTLTRLRPAKSILQDITQDGNLFFVVVCLVIGNAIALPIMFFVALSTSEPISWQVLLGGLGIGLIVRTPAAILWRVSNLVTRDYGVNALNYLEPLFALLWLGLFWDVTIENVGLSDYRCERCHGIEHSNQLKG